MPTPPDWFAAVPAWALGASARLAVAVLLVLLIRRALGRHLPAPWRGALWALVAVRAVTPWEPTSPTSLFGLAGLSSRAAGSPAPDAGPGTGSLVVRSGVRPMESSVVASPIEQTRDARLELAGALGPAPRTTSAWRTLLAAVWYAGALLYLTHATLAARRFRRRLNPQSVTDPPLLDLLDTCRTRMRVPHPVRLATSDAVVTPALVGTRRPTILLPPSLDRTDLDALAHVFLHELAHVRRRDLLVERLLTLLTALHWFNPLARLAARAYRADREIARDAMAVRALRDGPAPPRRRRLRYADTLLRLAQSPAGRGTPALGIVDDRGALTERFAMLARPPRRSLPIALAAAAAVALVGCTTLTAPPAAPPAAATAQSPLEFAAEGDVVTRVYDVRDLIARVPNHDPDIDAAARRAARPKDVATSPASVASDPVAAPRPVAAPAAPDWNGGSTRPITPATSAPITQLLTLVRDTVDPNSWEGQPAAPRAAHTPGALRELSGHLIVRQTRANHDAVARLLAQLRETQSLQILTESRFLLFDPAALAKAYPEFAATFDRPAPADKSGLALATYLTPAQTESLLKAVAAQKDAATLAAPRVVSLNGQRAYVQVGSERAYVADLLPVGKAPNANWEPVIDTVQTGILLDLQATASADRKFLTLALRPRVSKLLAMDAVPLVAPPAGHPVPAGPAVVQQPRLNVSEVRTTVSVPDGQTLVLGGLEDTAGLLAPDDPAVKPRPGHRLYILVTPKLLPPTPAP